MDSALDVFQFAVRYLALLQLVAVVRASYSWLARPRWWGCDNHRCGVLTPMTWRQWFGPIKCCNCRSMSGRKIGRG